jgi:hypothetical protein
VPLLTTLSAIIGTVDGNNGWHLLVDARGRLPTSLGEMKFGRLIDGGVRGGDAAQLLGGVPKNVTVSALA